MHDGALRCLPQNYEKRTQVINKEDTKMSKQEMKEKMKELENRRFFLAMKDRWNSSDYALDDKLFHEWLELKNKVEK